MKKFNDYMNDIEMTDAEVDAYFAAAQNAHSAEKTRARKRRHDSRRMKARRFEDRSIYVDVPTDEHEKNVVKGMCGKTSLVNSKVHGPNHSFEMGAGNQRRHEIALDKLREI